MGRDIPGFHEIELWDSSPTVLAIEVGTWSTADNLFAVGQDITDRCFKVGIHVRHMSLTLTACKKYGTDTPC
jgi:hypothetical protein